MNILSGSAHKYGDNIDTDVIIPARHCISVNPDDLAPHCLEDLDPKFVGSVKSGDILVAGENFGCGSSRENAPIAIKGVGISCVIAKSFARIFYRNAINIGLPILEASEAVSESETGDELEVDLDAGKIRNVTRRREYVAAAFPKMIQEIIAAGGMVPYIKSRHGRSSEKV